MFQIRELESLDLHLLALLLLSALRLQRELHERRVLQFGYLVLPSKHTQRDSPLDLAYANRKIEYHAHQLRQIHQVRFRGQMPHRRYLKQRFPMQLPIRVLTFQVPVVLRHVDLARHTKYVRP